MASEHERGLNALAEGRFAWARIHFAAAAEEGEPEAWRLAGSAWLRGPSQSLASAIDSFRRYLELHPEHEEVRRRLAQCLLDTGQRQEALELLADLEPTPQVELLQAELWLDSDPAMALEIAGGIPAEAEGSFRAASLAAEALDRLGREEEALASTRESLRRNPLQDQVWYRLSRLLVRSGEMGEAVRVVALSQQLAELEPAEGGRSITERLRLLNQLLPDLDPANPYVAELRTRLLLAGGAPAEARVAMAELESMGEPDIDLRLDFADLLLRLGELDEAKERLQSILSRDSGQRRARDLMIRIHLTAGDLPSARLLAEEGVAEDPLLARFHLRLGQVARGEGDPATALAYWRRALDLAPWQAEWRIEGARYLLEEARRKEAIRWLEEAPEAHPGIERLKRQLDRGRAPGDEA